MDTLVPPPTDELLCNTSSHAGNDDSNNLTAIPPETCIPDQVVEEQMDHHIHQAFTFIPKIYHPPATTSVATPTTLVDWFSYLDYMDQHHVRPIHNTSRHVAVDCEMVGTGPKGSRSVLARVSMVDYSGTVLLDTHVDPHFKVTDYRTKWSGVRERDLIGAPSFTQVAKLVAKLTNDRMLVGHSLRYDLDALKLNHPKRQCCDVFTYTHLRSILNSQSLKLATLSKLILGVTIQNGSHDSVDDARASMLIFRLFRPDFAQP